MSQYVETPTKAFTAGGAIADHLRVKLSSGLLAAGGLADQDVGVIERQTFASGDRAAVRLRSAQGTVKMIADGAISKGAAVYTAASGKVSATVAPTAHMRGYAMEAATADGDVIEVLQAFNAGASPTKIMTAGGAIATTLRVKLSSSKLAVAGLADQDIGVIEEAAAADLDAVPVRLRSAQGTVNVTAAGAVSVGAAVYTAADGKVSATGAATSFLYGYALTASTEDGDVIEILPVFSNVAET